MKLKPFATIMFALFITITTVDSQTGVWLVEEPGRLYFDTFKGDATKDTLAYLHDLPLWLTPGIAKLGLEHPGEAIPLKSWSEKNVIAWGFKYQNVKKVESTRFVNGTFSSPTITTNADAPVINKLMIVALTLAILGVSFGAYFLSISMRIGEVHKNVAALIGICIGAALVTIGAVTIIMNLAIGFWAYYISFPFFALLFWSVWTYSKKRNPSPKFRIPIT